MGTKFCPYCKVEKSLSDFKNTYEKAICIECIEKIYSKRSDTILRKSLRQCRVCKQSKDPDKFKTIDRCIYCFEEERRVAARERARSKRRKQKEESLKARKQITIDEFVENFKSVPKQTIKRKNGPQISLTNYFRRNYLQSLVDNIEWKKGIRGAEIGISHDQRIVILKTRNNSSDLCYKWEINELDGTKIFASAHKSANPNLAKLSAVSKLDYFVKQKDKSVSIDYLAVNEWPDKNKT